jgi:hypothetical protein
MDFIDASKSKRGHDAVLVIVCRLSKKLISISTIRKATAQDLAWLFLEGYYHYYRALSTIMSDYRL